jgi:hypothetical protein
MSSGKIADAVNAAWENKASKMDWLGLENTLREYVRVTGNEEVDEIVAAFTKRGHELITEG